MSEKYNFIGNIVNYKNIDDNSIQFSFENNETVRIYILKEDTIRVRFSQYGEFSKDFSYALINHNLKSEYKIEDLESTIKISTKKLTLEINKSPFKITFKDKDFVISEDDFPIAYCGSEIETFKKISYSEKFFGLGEKTGKLNKRGEFYKMWNSDVPFYKMNDDPLYLSIPFFIGLKENKTFGYFLDNTYETFFNLGASQDRYYSFGSKNGELNYYFFYGPKIDSVVESYHDLTGNLDLPPIWTLGYQQCRWSYYPDKEVLRIAKTFRDKQIPLDVLYLDIDWMQDYKVFEWNEKRFPNPKLLSDELSNLGINLITILDPGVKAEKGYKTSDSGIKENIFAKYPDQTFYKGQVWAGWSYFPDFTMEKGRNWWSNNVTEMYQKGIKGFWNDMNEPATWGQAFPDIVEFDFDGSKKNHKAVHNVYGMQMARATYEGAKNNSNKNRFLNVTRAGYSGIQRYSAVWTGDNIASEEHYLLSATMLQNMSLSGISFIGPDVGGFVETPSKELFARWMQLGVFTPFFRNHSIKNSNSQEPWCFGEEVEENVKKWLEIRYKLLPYIYNCFYQTYKNNTPIIKPLFWYDQHDENLYEEKYQNQYFFGESFLVIPAKSNQDFTEVYLPKGNWYSFADNSLYKGGRSILVNSNWKTLPVFVKAGTIIPMWEAQNYSTEKTQEKVYLHIYSGSGFEYLYYEDDYQTYDYESKKYNLTKIIYSEANQEININDEFTNYQSNIKEWQIILYGINDLKSVLVNNKPIKFQNEKGVLEFNIAKSKKIKIELIEN